MTPTRIWRIQIALLIAAASIIVGVTGATLAQSRRSNEEYDLRRMERRLDKHDEQSAQWRVEYEKRLTLLESAQASTREWQEKVEKLLYGALSALLLLIVETLWGMMVWKRYAKAKTIAD